MLRFRHPVPTALASDIEAATQRIGGELLREAREREASAFSRQFWSDRFMAYALHDAALRAQLFRFVDVFPSLRTPQEVQQHLDEYLSQPGVKLPAGLSLGIAAGGMFGGTLAKTISAQVRSMASSFIAGATLADAAIAIRKQWDSGVGFSIDLLGEACVSNTEASAYRQKYLQWIEQLPDLTRDWPARANLESDHLGALPRSSISIKVSAIDGHVSVSDFQGTLDRMHASLAPLLREAGGRGVLVYFDMEQHELKELTSALFRRCCETIQFAGGIALQAYLRSADADARSLIDWARASGRSIYVRLIKGAYWDYETIHAGLMGWETPVWEHKAQTDSCFERLTELFIREMPRSHGEAGVKLAMGTHNVRSVAHGLACLEAGGLPLNAIEFQALRGMADDLKGALVARGCRVREYVPVGELIPGMAYLVRRLLENSSNEAFVRQSHLRELTDEQLLAPPVPIEQKHAPAGGFHNEPHRDFAEKQHRDSFANALRAGRAIERPAECTQAEASAAVDRATEAAERWRRVDVLARARCLQRAAAILRSQRDRLCAIEVMEAFKTWAEADADVCEAIDFCEFYAMQAQATLAPRTLASPGGEDNRLLHEPRGVCVVISPWNFPLAICAGMTVASLVTGNPTVVKPAEQTPTIAGELCKALWEAGVPKDVLQFVPGPGETIGAALVRNPHVALVAFTGSSAVGLDILAAARAQVASAHLPLKHVVCEMGGKNAIIVDTSADMDDAVLGVRASAFSHAGQKCSACSRAIVLQGVHDTFVDRLVESARSLVVGDASDPATDVGPLIDDEAAGKVRRYIEIGMGEGMLRTPEAAAINGRLVPPHIFDDVAPSARIASEEIFGPVLSVIRANTFQEAIQIANASPFKLTGGVFSRTPSHLELARREFRVGDLYLNRQITGALVGRQPFGGFGLSGLGTQAGGAEYLLQFVHPRMVSENTLRRGFVPDRQD